MRWWCDGFANVVVVGVILETVMLMVVGVWCVVTVMVVGLH